jgi:dTMP kinase
MAEGGLVTMEGVEGAGKSTQITRLGAWLESLGVRVVATSEPDGSPLGPWVRRILAERSELDPVTECLLFTAARAEHVRRVIRPALGRGAVVLSDRYADSTVAYQGYGRGAPLEVIAELNRLATDGLTPDLTLVLDLDPEEGLRRVRRRSEPADPFERLGLEFHERVRKGFRAIHERAPERVVLIDAARSEESVAAAIRAAVGARLGLGAVR